MKGRTKGAKAGHKLLKRKADALMVKFRAMAAEIKTRKEMVGETLKEAYWTASEAKHSAGEGVTCVRELSVFAVRSGARPPPGWLCGPEGRGRAGAHGAHGRARQAHAAGARDRRTRRACHGFLGHGGARAAERATTAVMTVRSLVVQGDDPRVSG